MSDVRLHTCGNSPLLVEPKMHSETRLKPVHNGALRITLPAIIFNCAARVCIFVPTAIKPVMRNCKETRGSRAVTKFPKINDTRRYAKSFGRCGTIRVTKISAAVRRDRRTFVFGTEPEETAHRAAFSTGLSYHCFFD